MIFEEKTSSSVFNHLAYHLHAKKWEKVKSLKFADGQTGEKEYLQIQNVIFKSIDLL